MQLPCRRSRLLRPSRRRPLDTHGLNRVDMFKLIANAAPEVLKPLLKARIMVCPAAGIEFLNGDEPGVRLRKKRPPG
jgi:hypothetical protein